MRNALFVVLLCSAWALALGGCGSGAGGGDNDYEAANRLIVTSVQGPDGTTVVSNAVEVTDDSGTDGTTNTNDADGSEDNGRPDPGEALVTPLSDDLGTISFKNEPRLGAGDGLDLSIYRVDITYLDANRQSRTFAPTKVYSVAQLVPTGGTADLTGVILVPVQMKSTIRDIFLSPSSAAALAAVRDWTAVVDIYARDERNDDDVHAQAQFSIHFINPMVEGN